MPVRFRILRAEAGSPAGVAADPPGSSPMAAGPTEERDFEIATDLDEINVGRQPGTAIELPFPAVSTVHARLFRGDLPADWWVEDLGSMNGTWVDGRRLGPRQPAPLRAGQRLRIATVDIVFEGWSKNPRGAESTASIARRLISDLFGVVGGEVPALIVEAGGTGAAPGTTTATATVRASATLALAARDRPYHAGRADGCDLVLTGEHVSREHAAFVRRWDGVVVRDLDSKNGVRVNGHPITGEHRLGDGDRIAVGAVTLRLSDPEDRYLRRLHDLSGPGASPPGLVHDSSRAGSSETSRARTAIPTPIASPATSAPAGVERQPPPRPTTRNRSTTPSITRYPARLSYRRLVALLLAATVVVVAATGLVLLLLSTR